VAGVGGRRLGVSVELLCKKYGLLGAAADLNAREAISTAFGKDCLFDAVNSFHVIEHLHHPKDYLLGCYDALVPRGVMRLGLPFYPSQRIRNHELAFRLGLANHPYNFGLPDHVSYFDRPTICRLMGDVGFELLDVRKTAFTSVHQIVEAAGRGNWLRNTTCRLALACDPLLRWVGSYQHLDILARKRG